MLHAGVLARKSTGFGNCREDDTELRPVMEVKTVPLGDRTTTEPVDPAEGVPPLMRLPAFSGKKD